MYFELSLYHQAQKELFLEMPVILSPLIPCPQVFVYVLSCLRAVSHLHPG